MGLQSKITDMVNKVTGKKSKKEERKTIEQVLQEPVEVVINQAHVDDWQYAKSGAAFEKLKDLLPNDRIKGFNIQAAISAPKTIRYRQRTTDFDGGVAGDYSFVDMSNGKMAVPYKLFKLLF